MCLGEVRFKFDLDSWAGGHEVDCEKGLGRSVQLWPRVFVFMVPSAVLDNMSFGEAPSSIGKRRHRLIYDAVEGEGCALYVYKCEVPV